MRARLSAISNYTTSQLLIILQNWTRNTSEIIVDGQMLIVTSVNFLSNDTTPVLTSIGPTQTPNTEPTTKRNVILYFSIGFVGTSFLFLAVSGIIMPFGLLKSKRNHKIVPKLAEYIIIYIYNNYVFTTEDLKCKEEMLKVKIVTIRQDKALL